MVTHLNGNHNSNGCTLVCESDYPVIDVTPFTPSKSKPGWKEQHAAFTHHIQWVDAEGISHGLTLRSDSLQDLMRDLRLVKSMIKAAKQKHAELQPKASEPQPQAQAEPDVQHCEIHNVDMPRRWSKRTRGHYFGHKCSDGSFCYGKAKT
jgi:hypothetical protein